tara:strand:+ start:3638 stop:3835 length:198 start_codon:yes stop_codon:yes gene_type:complete
MNRCKALLRSSRIVVSGDEKLYCMQLPQTVLDSIGWEINDVIIIDTIKNGINISIQLRKEASDEE